MSKKSLGYEAIDSSSEILHSVSKYLFSNPELAFKENKSHDYLCDFLKLHGFNVQRNFIHETGFRANFETSPKPHFAILVEYDALPEIGHACGHNLIAESSIATALGLQNIMKKGAQCKLSVFGTPAEEGGGGKIKFVTEGLFKDVDVCIMSHPFKFNMVHLNLLALIGLKVTYTGKESHASVDPWEGKNALDAAVLAYQSISCLRQQIKPSCRVHGIISNGGRDPLVIPSQTELRYYIRDTNRHGLMELLPRIYACFESAATMTGCEVSITETCPLYEDLISNSVLKEIFYKNALELGISFHVDSGDLSGSSDVGNVSHVCPTIHPMFYIGTGSENHTIEFAKCANTEEGHLLSLRQGKAMLGVLVDVMEDESGRLLERIKETFKADITLT